MVDPVSEFLPTVGSPAQNASFDRDGRVPAIPDGGGCFWTMPSVASPMPRPCRMFLLRC